MTENHKSGFITIIGRPNVGKSTFLNYVLGQKITIMSDKPQTTRNKIQGVLTSENAQYIFIDTPGIHKPKHQLGNFMVDMAEQTLSDVDIILFMTNASEKFGPGEQYILDRLKNINTPVFLVINKVDLIEQNDILPIITQYNDKYEFSEVIPISAKEGHNVDTLLRELHGYLPEGPQFYPKDQITDHPERFIMSELIREKILHETEEEIPHSVVVVIENIEENKNQKVHVQASIIVDRKSQKGIIIGKQGKMLKKIGQRSRVDIEHLLGSKVYLELWVKVESNWRNRANQLREFGYEKDNY